MQNVSRKRIRPSPEAGNHVRLRPRMRTRDLPARGRPPDAGSTGAQSPLPCPSPETERGTPFGVPPSFRSVRDADYQLDLSAPGSSPRWARLRKQIRQIPYFLKYACGRPQILQRLYSLVENFGARCCLIFIDVLAMNFSPFYFANGILNCVNNSRASSSVLAVVTKITSIPLTLSILSYSISGKISCSLIPSA